MTIQDISEAIKSGKHIRIKDYLKPVSSNRTTEEVADVVFDATLEPYNQLLRKAKREVDSYPKIELSRLKAKHNATVEDATKALQEVQTSLAKKVQSTSDSTTNRDLIYHTSYFTEDPETGYLYFVGKKISEHIKKKGSYKQVNSRPKTLIKRDINNSLATSLKRWKIHKSEIEDRVEIL